MCVPWHSAQVRDDFEETFLSVSLYVGFRYWTKAFQHACWPENTQVSSEHLYLSWLAGPS